MANPLVTWTCRIPEGVDFLALCCSMLSLYQFDCNAPKEVQMQVNIWKLIVCATSCKTSILMLNILKIVEQCMKNISTGKNKALFPFLFSRTFQHLSFMLLSQLILFYHIFVAILIQIPFDV